MQDETKYVTLFMGGIFVIIIILSGLFTILKIHKENNAFCRDHGYEESTDYLIPMNYSHKYIECDNKSIFKVHNVRKCTEYNIKFNECIKKEIVIEIIE